jgi:hypothetical protein
MRGTQDGLIGPAGPLFVFPRDTADHETTTTADANVGHPASHRGASGIFREAKTGFQCGDKRALRANPYRASGGFQEHWVMRALFAHYANNASRSLRPQSRRTRGNNLTLSPKAL